MTQLAQPHRQTRIREVDPFGVTRPLRPYDPTAAGTSAADHRPVSQMPAHKPIPGFGAVVMSLGSPLSGDEGFGLHALQTIAACKWAEPVTFLDGDLIGPHLLAYLEASDRLLVLDVVPSTAPPGTIFELNRDELMGSSGRHLLQHRPTLRETVNLAHLRQNLPSELILLGVQPVSLAFGAPLSLPVVQGLGRVVDRALAILDAWRPV